MIRRAVIRIEGRVQGVFFRVAAKETAEGLGLAGSVRNAADGSVTVDVEGEADAVADMVDWCAEGSRAASVARVDVRDLEPAGRVGFEID